MLGVLGGAAGSAVGYDRFLWSDEPALAETDLELTAKDVTIESDCGNIANAVIDDVSTITVEYSNFPTAVLEDDYQFDFTIEANPNVGDRTDRSGWSDPHNDAPHDLQAVLDGMDGDGSESDPYQITNDHGLQAVDADPQGNYELARNIDATGTSEWNDGAGFDPIGDSDGEEFEGVLDGNGHRICGLAIDREQDAVGLVGRNRGDVRNVGLLNADVSGEDGTGGLVGANAGTVENTYIVASTVDGADSVGGLVGISDGTITESYADCDTVNGNEIVGGLLGANVETDNGSVRVGTVTKSFSYSDVSGAEAGIGGLVGVNVSVIETSHAGGDLAAHNLAGGVAGTNVLEEDDSGLIGTLLGLLLGLIGAVLGLLLDLLVLLGEDRELASEEGYISESYSIVETIDIEEDEDDELSGSLVGSNDGDVNEGTIESAYWDEDRYTEGIGGDEDGETDDVEGLSTGEMQGGLASDNMDGFDFTDTWDTVDEGYPQLSDNPEPVIESESSGESTELEALVDHSEPVEELLTAEDLPHGDVSVALQELDINDAPLSEHTHISTDFRELEPQEHVDETLTDIEFELSVELVHEGDTIDSDAAGPTTATVIVEVTYLYS